MPPPAQADKKYMFDRRIEPRMLCADMVDVHWKDKTGRIRKGVANLEDISLSGACLQFDQPVPLQTEVRISYPKGELLGKVRYCVYREIGYFLGIEFDPGCRWSSRHFKPQHLLDPRRLVIRSVNRASKFAN
ncbi:MAG TPA: PilZ domain-containing protein [Bryobacteraceae bacterium]|jgi:PilZ domain|nr:PilZ domain-containing protein [Bryobacteraceae bacterium]